MKALIVDDNRTFSTQAAKFIRKHGHEAVTACCVEGALDYITVCSFDVCFVETHMEQEKGFDLINKIKGLQPDLTTIAITKSTNHGFYSAKKMDEKTQLLRKPIPARYILEVISALEKTK